MKVRDALEMMLDAVNDDNVVIGMTLRIQKRLDREQGTNPLGMELIYYRMIPVIVFKSLHEEQAGILQALATGQQVILLHDEMLAEGWV